MRNIILIFMIFLVGSCTNKNDHVKEMDMDDVKLKLEQISKMKIYLGHQSVGANILEGMKKLSEKAQVPINVWSFDEYIEKVNKNEAIPQGLLVHSMIGKNTKPLLKCEDFIHQVKQLPVPFDLVMMKFCYVDFSAEADVSELVNSYLESIKIVESSTPHKNVGFITVPVVERQSWLRKTLKQILGKKDKTQIANVNRNKFNYLLKNSVADKNKIFDLARIEATCPTGKINKDESREFPVYWLCSEYTYDGQHLNERGQIIVAKQFLDFIIKFREEND